MRTTMGTEVGLCRPMERALHIDRFSLTPGLVGTGEGEEAPQFGVRVLVSEGEAGPLQVD